VLRRKPGAPTPTDPIDLELLEAIDEGVSWRGLLRSASCPPDEAEGRLMRLLMTGVLEGEPGEAAAPRPAPPLPSQRPSTVPSPRPVTSSSAPPAGALPPTGTPSPASAPPATGAHAAGESLLRELMRRTTGSAFTPVSVEAMRRSSVPPSARPGDPGASGVNARVSTMPPAPASAPPASTDARVSSAPAEPARRPASTPPAATRVSESAPRAQSITPDPYSTSSSLPPVASSRPSSPGALSVSSALLPLIEEFSHGEGIHRWAAARLREALLEELAGNVTQAIAILQVVMAQIEEPRLRAERDRLQQQLKAANSGVHRSRALDLERSSRPREAVEAWRKVLDANPQDTEAALHAALCALEAGDLKQAGLFAKRAVELAPNNINAHKILHRFFRKSGMERSAKREEEIIQKLKKA
jgi:hypothetical protein